jgi:hypothetical protein
MRPAIQRLLIYMEGSGEMCVLQTAKPAKQFTSMNLKTLLVVATNESSAVHHEIAD